MIESASIAGHNIDPHFYHRQAPHCFRGDRNWVLGQTELMNFARCPRRWVRTLDAKETDSTDWGSLIDCLILTPSRFVKRFAVTPETYTHAKSGEAKPWNWNANVCKEWKIDAAGKKIVKSSTLTNAQKAAERILKDVEIRKLLRCSRKQTMIVGCWKDEEWNIAVPLKALVDLVPNPRSKQFGKCLADLKTCSDASPRAWERQVFLYHLHVQAAFYLDLFNAATGEKRNVFLHVLSESDPPYETGRRILSEDFIQLGRDTYTNALRWYCRCLANDRWPGYDDEQGELIQGWRTVSPRPWMIDDGIPRQVPEDSEQAIRRAGL